MENRLLVVFVSLIAGFCAEAPQCLAESDLRLTLVIYDYAHVGEQTLVDAERTTSHIFERAGVQLFWREGFSYAAERQNAVVPESEDPTTLVVKLEPESDAARYGVLSNCGGIALGPNATVFVRRSDGTWLGTIIAHELGHILLGANAHSVTGIMRPTLLAEDWVKAEQGTLGFTRSQNQQIRRWIAQRSRQLNLPAESKAASILNNHTVFGRRR